MRKEYMIVVKCNKESLSAECGKWGIEVLTATVSTRDVGTSFAIVRADDTVLNQWFVDRTVTPYPPGTLLFWRPEEA